MDFTFAEHILILILILILKLILLLILIIKEFWILKKQLKNKNRIIG